MVSARNYAAQAEKAVRDMASNLLSEDAQVKRPLTQKSLFHVCEIISKAVHFVIPDNGSILDDSKKGIRGQEIHLPFPIITVEYFDNRLARQGNVQTSKRVVIAINNNELRKYYDGNYPHDGFCVMSIFYAEGRWWPQMLGGFIPQKWESIFEKTGNYNNFDFFLVGPEICQEVLSEDKKYLEAVYPDVMSDCSNILELVEALSCRNVSTDIFQESSHVNAKRIKDGKLPIYETKCLVINANREHQISGQYQGGSHASPRQHLRRGHIRRLPSGNYWVNSCVVGKSADGIIKKSYQITSGY